ncbi:MAG: hypothetical protein HQK66_13995 [Desulfamplus sp.]|nr:hypothetical protein [Desulfamplus sp.]
MKKINPIRCTIALVMLFSSLFFLGVFPVIGETGSQESNIIRAKIGIQVISGERTFTARGRQPLTPGDLIRLYIHTEKECYIYVIHTDHHSVELMNITEQKIQSSTLILPSAQTCYAIEGRHDRQRLTIICTPDKLTELADIESNPPEYEEWVSLETRLQKRSSMLVTDEMPSPIALGGATRGGMSRKTSEDHGNVSTFLRELPTFSGKGLLIRTYEFHIQK